MQTRSPGSTNGVLMPLNRSVSSHLNNSLSCSCGQCDSTRKSLTYQYPFVVVKNLFPLIPHAVRGMNGMK